MSHEHQKGQKCFLCDGGTKKDLAEWQDKNMEKYGFYMHFVPDGHFINAHTHGFDKTWGHLDFQIVLPLEQKLISSFFWTFADRVKAGEKFEADTSVDKVIKNMPVRLTRAHENDRDVLRIIFPDKNGKFYGDPGVDEAYAHQVEHVEENDEVPPDLAMN